jgi:hypothetical protein
MDKRPSRIDWGAVGDLVCESRQEGAAMTDTIALDSQADDQKLLAQVVGYYHQTLRQTPDALTYLRRRGISNGQAIDHFRLGHADRHLGKLLPSKDSRVGREIRGRLEALGLFRQSGHEHFAGSITFPILAADSTGLIVDIYGRKLLGKRLRKGTPLHTHLNDQGRGVWNVEAFGSTDEIVLCGSLWDALTFWSQGYRNATTMFGPDDLTADILAAFAEFQIKRVLTPCEKVTARLLAVGLEVFLLKLPLGVDVNAYARQVKDPADALSSLLRTAEWMGRGSPSAGVRIPIRTAEPATDQPHAETDQHRDDIPVEVEAANENRKGEQDAQDHDTPIRTSSPVPPAPQEIEAEVSDDELSVTFGDRHYRVRGLAKNTTWDVLRVNVLVSNDTGLFVDTLDLYSAKHRNLFVSQAAAELGVEVQTVKKDVGQLLLKLEELQDRQMRALLNPQPASPEMSPQEKKAALRLLCDPDLMTRIVGDFAVVGERTNKLVGYLAAVSRKLDQPLAVLIQSSTAAGKTTLMEAVLGFVPPEEVVKYSAMTGQSLYYMSERSLKHKILAIVEEEGAERVSYALKLLQSEGELRIASTGKELSTARLVTKEYRVEGPVMIFLTTTSIQADEELLNRCLVLTVDEDREQTRAIHQLQRQQQTLQGQLEAQAHLETLKLHRNAQRLLRPVLVANPYAERLTFLDDKTRTRRDHIKYLTLIRTIALLHQYQRPVRTVEHQGKTVEFIEVALEDIEQANQLAAAVLGRSLDDLPPQTRRLLNLLDKMVAAACEEKGLDRADYRFSRRDVRKATGLGDTQLKVHLARLAEMEFLLVHRERNGGRLLYELLYDPPAEEGGRVLARLFDVEELRRDQVGQNGKRSGSGRPSVGSKSGGGRGKKIDATPEATGTDDPRRVTTG